MRKATLQLSTSLPKMDWNKKKHCGIYMQEQKILDGSEVKLSAKT